MQINVHRDVVARREADSVILNPDALWLVFAEADFEKLAGPWEDDRDGDGSPAWTPGRVRRNVNGEVVAYVGRLGTEPMWGRPSRRNAPSTGDRPGTEADADRALLADGFALVGGPVLEAK